MKKRVRGASGAKRRLSKAGIRVVMIFGLLALLAVALLLSPIFEVVAIEVVGNSALCEARILEASQISYGQSILSFSAGRAARMVSDLPRVREAAVARQMPGRVIISVIERTPVGNVRLPHVDTYLLIDDMGVVLESVSAPAPSLPVVVGLEFSEFALGETLVVANPGVFSDILTLSRIFRRHDFNPSSISMSDGDIFLNVGHFGVYFGGMANAERKVQYLVAIMDQYAVEIRGFFDITDVNRPRFWPAR